MNENTELTSAGEPALVYKEPIDRTGMGGPKPKPKDQLQSVVKRAYFTPERWDQIQDLMSLAGFKTPREFSAFINELLSQTTSQKSQPLIDEYVLALIITMLNSIKRELSNLGNNRNQIAKYLNNKLNDDSYIYDLLSREVYEIKDARKLLELIYKCLEVKL